MVKSFKEVEGDARKGVEEVLKKIGAKTRVEEIRVVNGEGGEKGNGCEIERRE